MLRIRTVPQLLQDRADSSREATDLRISLRETTASLLRDSSRGATVRASSRADSSRDLQIRVDSSREALRVASSRDLQTRAASSREALRVALIRKTDSRTLPERSSSLSLSFALRP
jgi:hypothetical protein